MQASPSIHTLLQQTLQDLAAKNPEGVIAAASHQPGSLFIGSAPLEWFESVAGYEAMMRSTAEGSSGNMPADLQIQAFEEGTVGWAAWRYSIRLPNGNAVKIRATGVFHQENGVWKLVQLHASVAVPDELVPSVAQPAG